MLKLNWGTGDRLLSWNPPLEKDGEEDQRELRHDINQPEFYKFELWRCMILMVPIQGNDRGYTQSVDHTQGIQSFFTVLILSIYEHEST